MYTPSKLIVKNIGPLENIQYDFDKKIVLLTGENLTDQGQDSNGSGKSFILESICYAVTGSSFRKVTDSELVREGEVEAYILLELLNNPLGRLITVERYIYSGNKSSRLIIAINGSEQKQITSVNEGNKFILAELGLSREDVLNYFMISKEKYASFFSSSDTAKKELISRFSKANLVDNIFPQIELDKNKKQAEQQKINNEIASIQSRIETLKEDIDPQKIKELQIENEQKVQVIELEIEGLFIENENLENINSEAQTKTKQLEQKLSEFKTDDNVFEKIKKHQFEIEKINKTITDLRKQTRESEALLSNIEKSLLGAVQCPKCEHKFNASDQNFDVQEGEVLSDELEQLIMGLKSEASTHLLNIPEHERVIRELNDEINKQKRVKNDLELEKQRLEANARNNNRTIASNQQLMVKKFELIEKLKNEVFTVDANKELKIKEAEQLLKQKNEQKEQIKFDLNFYDEWSLNFKSFKTYLANKSLYNITNQTNLYLEKLGSSIRVKFEGYKELKSGKTKEQIDIRIFKFGEDRGSFGKLSGGEKARVEVATILALSSLINLSSEAGGLNFVIVDEILESLDSTGLRSIIKAMANIDQHVMLVTHGKVDSTEGFNEVRIVKRNGKSSLEKY
jgi:exonuclease SbcC